MPDEKEKDKDMEERTVGAEAAEETEATGTAAGDAAVGSGEEAAAQAPAEEPGEDDVPIDRLIRLCQERICPGCTVKAEADDVRLRALAEVENVKKRLLREKEEQFKYAAEDVLRDLLPVLDNLDLAIQYAGGDPACRNLLTGVEMTRKIFLDILRNHGLTPLGEVGEAFDPEVHEAVSQEAREGAAPGTVLAVQLRGYRLKERTLRPAKVVVGA